MNNKMKKKEIEMPLNVVLDISLFVSNGHELEYIFQSLFLKLIVLSKQKKLQDSSYKLCSYVAIH